eukprot:748064-Hanusia_phi.AAC.3
MRSSFGQSKDRQNSNYSMRLSHNKENGTEKWAEEGHECEFGGILGQHLRILVLMEGMGKGWRKRRVERSMLGTRR